MEHSSVITLHSRLDCVDAAAQLIANADRSIAIFSQQLEPVLYNHRSLCETLSVLARKNRHTTIRILAQQTKSISDGHCLISLSQQLSSSVQIRIPATPELKSYTKSLLIVDNHSMMNIDNPERFEGTLVENNRLHVKTELEFFDHAWENSLPDQNSRRLHI